MTHHGLSLTHWKDRLPGRCQVCGRWPAQPLCDACLQRHATPRLRCQLCASPLPHEGPLCGPCLTRPNPTALQTCLAAIDYDHPWDSLIARWKFRGDTGWSGQWAALMLREPRARELWLAAALIVPVPVGPARLANRGYNQAWELVKALRRRAPAPHPRAIPDALVRLREAADQHSLPREQRLLNLRGTFAAHPRWQGTLAGRPVLLVDDVSTTGATLEAAAQALLSAGATRVDALVLARTPPPQ